MKVGYCTERPYRWVAEDDVLKNHAFFALSNPHFDRDKAPAIRDDAKKIALPDPDERTPGSVKFRTATTRLPVVDRSLPDSLSLKF
jgi:hypothetical protein